MSKYKFMLLGIDESECAQIRPHLDQAMDKSGGLFTCDCLLVQDTCQFLDAKFGNYAGVIPIVSQASLASPTFCATLQTALEYFTRADTFCIVPWLKNVTVENIEFAAKRGNVAAEFLLDTVHINDRLVTSSDVTETLVKCCNNMHDLLIAEKWEMMTSRIAVILGYIALTVLYATAILVYVVAFFKDGTVKGPDFIEAIIRNVRTDVMNCVSVSIISAFSIYFLQLLRLKLRGSRLASYYPHMKVEFQPVLFLCAGAAFLIYQLEMLPDTKIIFIGVGIGISIIGLFRAGCRAKMGPLSFVEIPKAIRSRTLLQVLYARMATCIAHTGVPFLTPLHSRIFISYSHSSGWCQSTAHRLADMIRKKGGYVFLDWQLLEAGFSWKAQLKQALNSSNVFVIVLDEQACQREWVSAEFSHAYLQKMLTASPEIVIIHPPHIDFSKLDVNFPNSWFFSEIVVQPLMNIPDWMRMKMATFEESTSDAMCTAIRFRHLYSSKWERFVGLLRVLRLLLIVPLQMTLAILSPFGVILLGILLFSDGSHGIASVLLKYCIETSRHAFWISIICSALVGFCSAICFSQGFSKRKSFSKNTNPVGDFAWKFLSACGFAYIAYYCSRQFEWQNYAIMYLAVHFGFSIGCISYKANATFNDTDIKTGNAPK